MYLHDKENGQWNSSDWGRKNHLGSGGCRFRFIRGKLLVSLNFVVGAYALGGGSVPARAFNCRYGCWIFRYLSPCLTYEFVVLEESGTYRLREPFGWGERSGHLPSWDMLEACIGSGPKILSDRTLTSNFLLQRYPIPIFWNPAGFSNRKP